MTDGVLVLAIGAGLVVSCAAAEFASGGRGTWAWGVLGPPGWIVAALRGVQMRLDGDPAPVYEEPETREPRPLLPTQRARLRKRRRDRHREEHVETLVPDDPPAMESETSS